MSLFPWEFAHTDGSPERDLSTGMRDNNTQGVVQVSEIVRWLMRTNATNLTDAAMRLASGKWREEL